MNFLIIAIPLNMKIKNFLRQMIVTFNVNLALANSRNCYKEEFIEKIQDYLEKHYEAENWGVIGEYGKVLTFFEKTEIFFKKLFGSFDGYFFWYLRKLMKKKTFTESQLIEKTGLKENFFSDLRNGKYVEIRSEEIWAVSLALQSDFKDVNKLFDLVGCRKL